VYIKKSSSNKHWQTIKHQHKTIEMKAIKTILVVIILTVITTNFTAQNPPPPPDNFQGNGNQSPPGGGTPIGSGLLIMLALGAAYGGNKLRNIRKNKPAE
jgi:hypothetical protein